MEEKFGFSTLNLDADYAENDTEQPRLHIEAYLEIL